MKEMSIDARKDDVMAIAIKCDDAVGEVVLLQLPEVVCPDEADMQLLDSSLLDDGQLVKGLRIGCGGGGAVKAQPQPASGIELDLQGFRSIRVEELQQPGKGVVGVRGRYCLFLGKNWNMFQHCYSSLSLTHSLWKVQTSR